MIIEFIFNIHQRTEQFVVVNTFILLIHMNGSTAAHMYVTTLRINEPNIIAIVRDTYRMGVWLGWHICYNATQVSQGQLRENRNLSLSIRAEAVLIYAPSVRVHNENN